MKPDMDSLALDDVERVKALLEHLCLALLTAESSAKQCGREDLEKALFAMRGAMEGFRGDMTALIEEWEEDP